MSASFLLALDTRPPQLTIQMASKVASPEVLEIVVDSDEDLSWATSILFESIE